MSCHRGPVVSQFYVKSRGLSEIGGVGIKPEDELTGEIIEIRELVFLGRDESTYCTRHGKRTSARNGS